MGEFEDKIHGRELDTAESTLQWSGRDGFFSSHFLSGVVEAARYFKNKLAPVEDERVKTAKELEASRDELDGIRLALGGDAADPANLADRVKELADASKRRLGLLERVSALNDAIDTENLDITVDGQVPDWLGPIYKLTGYIDQNVGEEVDPD